MPNSRTSRFILTLAATFAVGCATTPVSPSSPSEASGTTTLTADQIAGTWTLSSMQTAGQAEQPVPSGATYRLTLGDDRISTTADCNVCSGGVVFGNRAVTIGPLLACTRAACPTMAFESSYVTTLAGDSAVRLEGDAFTMTSSRGILRFRR